uniref:Uncharacterized protein n=2 Tax=Magallana TaxID=2171616 RepID=K1PG38_MAGGI
MVLPVVIAGVLTTVGAYIGTPTVLSALGFTKAGVAVGSMAAAVQTPATAAGGFFALCQSAGVLGLAASTKAAISAVAGAVVSVAAYAKKIDRHPDYCRVEAFVIIFRMVLPVVIAGVLTTVGAYIGTPTVLSVVGFTKAGVTVGSMAAAVQTPATAAGGFFALCQSAGVLGLAASTKAAISAVAGAVVSVAAYVWPWSLLL